MPAERRATGPADQPARLTGGPPPAAAAADDASGGGDFAHACERLDAMHREDPRADPGGEPCSVVYHQRMAAWLEALEPGASEALRLAVRAQHVRRWTIPRSDFPAGRRGYLAWRNACMRMHAGVAGEVLAAAGYGAAAVERVRDLVQKRRLHADPEAQALEDAACLVFLEGYLAGFAAEFAVGDGAGDEAKLVDILRKTWAKMSPRARDAALALDLPPPVRELVDRALTG
jgi:hypothetical protein